MTNTINLIKKEFNKEDVIVALIDCNWYDREDFDWLTKEEVIDQYWEEIESSYLRYNFGIDIKD